jgi:three-Cys-motif partner protein
VPRPIGDWTLDKLKILESYLPGYLQATTAALERIYIDAFAGPGTNQLESGEIVDGSPLIAAKAVAKNGTRFTRLFFVERDPRVAAELRGLLADSGTEGRAQVLEGDVNTKLPALLQTLPQRSPTFVFIDPTGIEPRWSTIVSLATKRTELLVNFPLGMSINRNAVRSSEKMDAYFGSSEWRTIFESPGIGRARRLLDLYKTRLAQLGYVHAVDDDRLVKTLDNHKLYYMMFVSKVPTAKKIMDWVFKQPDAHGQHRMSL